MNSQRFARRWSTLIVLGAIACAPFLSKANAQTAEPRHRDDYYSDNDSWRNQVRVVGVVTRETRNDQFRMRADDGKNYRVSVGQADNARVVIGDRIEVTGRMDGKTLIARRITQLGINPGGGGSLTIQRGTVVSSTNYSSLELQSEDGRFYRVRARNGNLSRFKLGDRVEARGYFDRDRIFIAESIELIGGGNGGGERITRRGTVTNIIDAAVFEMRGEDGITYRVQGPFRAQRSTSAVVRVGDRIEVQGSFDRDRVLIADNVRVLSTGSTGGTSGVRITRRGTVTNIIDAAVFEMRGEDGITYRVQGPFRAQRSTSAVIRVGDRVEVQGSFDRDRILTADSVQVLGRSKVDVGNERTEGSQVNLTATVLRVDRFLMLWILQVRGQDGRQYQVNYNGPNTFSVNDRVRIIGTFRSGILVSNNVSRY